jgi:hypothetical protein
MPDMDQQMINTKVYVGTPPFWMGTEVPQDIAKRWAGPVAHMWRRGVVDALKQINEVHDLSAEMPGWIAAEKMDRIKRQQWRDKVSA